jgi:hypothetical protein
MEATERSNRLDSPVTGRDGHALGDAGEEITLVEYGSFNCPSCLAANEVIANLRDHFGGRMAYVFRHRPLTGNDDARRAAELAEYAHQTTDQYWQAHHALMTRGPILRPGDFEAVAEELRLPPRDGQHENAWRRAQAKVQQDIDSAWRSGARVSPTFFINNRRYEGAWDESTLAEAMLGSLGHRMQTAALDFARWAPSTGLLLMINAGLAWAATILHGHERLIFAILRLGDRETRRHDPRLRPRRKTRGLFLAPDVRRRALAGIGFTMSLYIAHKAFPDEPDFAAAKIGIFLASLIAGGLGTALLWSAGASGSLERDRPA